MQARILGAALAVLVAVGVLAATVPASADTTNPTPTATLDCTNPLGGSPPPRSEVVGDQIALVTSRSRSDAMQAARYTDPAMPRYRLFSKSPLYLRHGSGEARIIVPRSERGRVALSWGNTDDDGTATRVFVAGPCPGGHSWTVFPGGYSVTTPHCVTLVVRSGGHEERVRIGVGKACPGQQPPPAGP